MSSRLRSGARWVASAFALVPLCSHALQGGYDPTVTPVVSPLNGQPTDVWKLAGTLSGASVSSPFSAVQIAPGWILSARHALPFAPYASGAAHTPQNNLFTPFVNKFGSSYLRQCFWPTDTDYTGGGTDDWALCQLETPIKVPATLAFPTLVQDYTALTNGYPRNMISPTMGAFLSVAYGSPTAGVARFAWVDFLGAPYILASNGTNTDTDYPWIVGMKAPAPTQLGGDSGSPLFWFPANGHAPGLGALAHWAGAVTGDTRFSQGALNWVSNLVRGNINTDGTTDSVTTSTAAAFGGAQQPSPPWLDTARIAVQGTSTPTSVTWGWPMPSSYASLVQNFLVTLYNGQNLQSSRFIKPSTSSSLTTFAAQGLQAGATYTMCAMPAGSGIAALGEVTIDNTNYNASVNFNRNCTQTYLSPAANAVPGLTISVFKQAFKILGGAVYPTYTASWSAPASPAGIQIVGYRVASTVGTDPESVIDSMGTQTGIGGGLVDAPSGTRICVTVTPITTPFTLGTKSAPACGVIP